MSQFRDTGWEDDNLVIFDTSVDKTVSVGCREYPSTGVGISVVVPCRDEKDTIRSCLGSILAQEEPEGGFEVIVVDGQSTDGTAEILAEMSAKEPRLRIVNNPAKTTPSAFNLGIRQARGAFVALMGAHNSYAPDYLRQCLSVARETGADNVGGSMIARGDTPLQRAIALAHHSSFACGGARWHNPDYNGEVDTVFGGFYRREALFRLGLFDETLLRNQDDEFNLRLTRSGGRIWHSPRIRSWYQPRSDLQSLFRQYLQYGYWKVRVIRKHRLPGSWRHLVPGCFVLALFVLPILGIYFEPLLWLWSTVVALYAAALLSASLRLAQRHGWEYLPFLPSVVAAYHVGYGTGFLYGVFECALRRAPAKRLSVLTRTAKAQH